MNKKRQVTSRHNSVRIQKTDQTTHITEIQPHNTIKDTRLFGDVASSVK